MPPAELRGCTEADGNDAQFLLLGPLSVVHQEKSIPLGPGKQRTLLAHFLLNANRPVSVRSSLEALWDDPPPSAVKNVQLYVGRIRRMLAGIESVCRLHTVDRGYQLDVDSERVDTEVFRRLVRDASRARRDRRLDQAVVLFGDALKLWRGKPLETLAGTVALDAEVGVLEDMRLMACEEYFGLMLETGHHRAAIPELRRMVAAYPRQELLRYQLMLALSRAGDRSAALSTYRSGYRLLVEDLGIEPSRPLRELHDAILADTAPTRTTSHATAPLRGTTPVRTARPGGRRGALQRAS
ncbi:AfsR/SARP family transcriptional regulator [Streptomyces sp. NPDC093990]|uniref:AfsR/SARP family transcriptional regulator n=1 Tax=Streptomyces sp. NPDC093990 TaxID=3155306 RepID=UPI003414C5FC